MNEQEFVEQLREVLEFVSDDLEISEDLEIRRIATFEEGGVLTMNHGLTVYLDDGTEFQVIVVRGRSAR